MAAAMSKAHVTGRANTWSGATMINRRLLIYGAPKAATGGTLTVGNVGGYWFQAGAAGYMINRVSYTVLSEAPINDEIEIAIQKPLIPPDE